MRGGKREEVRAGKCRAVWSQVRHQLLPRRRWEPWRAVGLGGTGPDSGAQKRSLVAAAGKTDCERRGQDPGDQG